MSKLKKMRLALAGAKKLSIELTLDSGVALIGPELWRFVETAPGEFAHRKVNLASPATASHAEWTLTTGDADWAALKIYWDAIEPEQPTWPYKATIAVAGPNGQLSPKGAGQENPSTIACMIGPKPPHGGSEMVAIYAD